MKATTAGEAAPESGNIELAPTDVMLCPVLGAQVHAGNMSGARGGRSGLIALYLAVRRLGFSIPLSVLVVTPVPFLANGVLGFFRNAIGFSVDLHELAGHPLDRGAGSGILTADGHGGVQFSAVEFERLFGYASADDALSAGDLGRFIRDNSVRDPDRIGTTLSYLEFGALLRVFGDDVEELGRAGIRLDLGKLWRLYLYESVPADFQPTRRTTVVSLALTVRAMKSQSRGRR